MNLVGKKSIHRRKKIFTYASLRKQQKDQYTQVYLCVYVQNFTPSDRCIQVLKPRQSQVDKKWTTIGPKYQCIILCIAEFLEWTRFSGILYTVPYCSTRLDNTKVMKVNAIMNQLLLEGVALEEVESFTYLGSIIGKKGGSDADVLRLQSCAKSLGILPYCL